MKFNIERGRIIIDLNTGANAEIQVDGRTQAEIVLGVPAGPEDLREQLRSATAALSACHMMRQVLSALEQPKQGRKESLRKASFADGLSAGLRGAYRYLGESGVAEPEASGTVDHDAFRAGWELGSAIYAATTMAETGEDPRKCWGAG